ncbi:MAG: hypothetical protein AAF433_15295 [Bacteroidota bacterium]
MPPGKRLGLYESPSKAVYKAIKKKLGLEAEEHEFYFLDYKAEQFGKRVFIMPRPFQVQEERGEHRFGVKVHYDFVYVCRVTGNPYLESSVFPKWYSLEKLKEVEAESHETMTFPDVIPTMERILQFYQSSPT